MLIMFNMLYKCYMFNKCYILNILNMCYMFNMLHMLNMLNISNICNICNICNIRDMIVGHMIIQLTIYSIFACSTNLISMTKKVMNVSFVLFAFFYKINLSFFGSNIQNLSGIFSCPEFVQFKLSEFLLCPEFVQNFILEKFWINSGHILDMSKF